MNDCFDVYLIIKSSDWNIAKRGVEYIRKNIDSVNICSQFH